MKKIIIIALCLCSLNSFATVAIDGLYTELFGGYSYLPDNISTTKNNFFYDKTKYHGGWHAGYRLGYKSSFLRYEGELTYINASLRKVDIDGITYDAYGYSRGFFAMANAYIDFPDFVCELNPYIGVGLGSGWLNTYINDDVNSLIFPTYKEKNTVFTYQAMAGITYNFTENYALSLGYRYMGSERANNYGDSFQAHLATLSVIYRFNSNFYK